jgi:hypothetical protein
MTIEDVIVGYLIKYLEIKSGNANYYHLVKSVLLNATTTLAI